MAEGNLTVNGIAISSPPSPPGLEGVRPSSKLQNEHLVYKKLDTPQAYTGPGENGFLHLFTIRGN